MDNPAVLTPFLQYGSFGLLALVLVAVGYAFRKMFDVFIEQAKDFSKVSIETVAVLNIIKDTLTSHAKDQDESNREIITALESLDRKINGVVK